MSMCIYLRYLLLNDHADNALLWGECAAFVGKGLYAAGKINDPTPKAIPQDQYADLFGNFTLSAIGLNAHNRAHRLRDIGWRPKELGVREAFGKEELPSEGHGGVQRLWKSCVIRD